MMKNFIFGFGAMVLLSVAFIYGAVFFTYWNLPDKKPLDPKDINYQTQHELWEKSQGTGIIVSRKSASVHNIFSWSNKASWYLPSEDQKTLFKDQSMYFHFTNRKRAEKAEIMLHLYTGAITVLLENIDYQQELSQMRSFSANSGDNAIQLDFSSLLRGISDIYTMKIRADSDLAVLDYHIRIKE